MSLLTIVVVLIVVGVLMWLVNTKIPMDATIKMILNVVVILSAFGLLDSLKSIHT